MPQKLTAREAIARSYPTWDRAMADRLIRWLDRCGYTIVEKAQQHDRSNHDGSSIVPEDDVSRPLETTH